MEIEFDTSKDAIDRVKHGLSLAFGTRVFEDENHFIIPTIQESDEGDRCKAVRVVDGRLWTAVDVYRGQTVRFLSARKSNTGDQRHYDRAFC